MPSDSHQQGQPANTNGNSNSNSSGSGSSKRQGSRPQQPLRAERVEWSLPITVHARMPPSSLGGEGKYNTMVMGWNESEEGNQLHGDHFNT